MAKQIENIRELVVTLVGQAVFLGAGVMYGGAIPLGLAKDPGWGTDIIIIVGCIALFIFVQRNMGKLISNYRRKN